MPQIVWVSSDSRIKDDSMQRMIRDAKTYGWKFVLAENGEMITVWWHEDDVETFSREYDS